MTHPRAAEAAPEVENRALRILCAEDNTANQMVLKSLIGATGAEVLLVKNGALAVEAFIEETFDLVLMDVQMPVMNGIDATLAIRAFEGQERRRPTPIIALTANFLPDQVAAYIEAGMDDALAKPIEVVRFFAVLDAVAASRAASSSFISKAA